MVGGAGGEAKVGVFGGGDNVNHQGTKNTKDHEGCSDWSGRDAIDECREWEGLGWC